MKKLFPALFGAICFLAFPVLGAQKFEITESAEKIPEVGIVRRYLVKCDLGNFSFIPPEGWGGKDDPENSRIVFSSPKLGAGFVLTLKPIQSPEAPAAAKEFWRKKLKELLPAAAVLEEFTAYTGGGEGTAFEISQSLPNQTAEAGRVAFVRLKKGTLQFQLLAPVETFARCHGVWTGVMNSFKQEEK